MLNRLRDVFRCFEEHEVRYLVIGGIAVVLHGVPRATFDLDVLIEATHDNAERLLAALKAAGLGTSDLTTPAGVLANEVTIFQDRIRIDVQTRTPGIEFEAAWSRRVSMEYEGQVLHVLGREDLIASKLAAGRKVDIEDARLLRASEEE